MHSFPRPPLYRGRSDPLLPPVCVGLVVGGQEQDRSYSIRVKVLTIWPNSLRLR